MNETCHLTYSSLCRKVNVNGKDIDVLIYKDIADEWFLEVVDGLGTSIICDDTFASDELAFNYSQVMIDAILRLSGGCG